MRIGSTKNWNFKLLNVYNFSKILFFCVFKILKIADKNSSNLKISLNFLRIGKSKLHRKITEFFKSIFPLRFFRNFFNKYDFSDKILQSGKNPFINHWQKTVIMYIFVRIYECYKKFIKGKRESNKNNFQNRHAVIFSWFDAILLMKILIKMYTLENWRIYIFIKIFEKQTDFEKTQKMYFYQRWVRGGKSSKFKLMSWLCKITRFFLIWRRLELFLTNILKNPVTRVHNKICPLTQWKTKLYLNV